MAATPRTTPALVEGIIDVETGADLTPFITTANLLVTSVCGNSGYDDSGIGSLMEVIERWLSAHFYGLYDQQLQAAKAGTVSVTYQTKVDMGLSATVWGQQAIRLDYLGNLAAMDNTAQTKKKVTIRVKWSGRHPSPWIEWLPGLPVVGN